MARSETTTESATIELDLANRCFFPSFKSKTLWRMRSMRPQTTIFNKLQISTVEFQTGSNKVLEGHFLECKWKARHLQKTDFTVTRANLGLLFIRLTIRGRYLRIHNTTSYWAHPNITTWETLFKEFPTNLEALCIQGTMVKLLTI